MTQHTIPPTARPQDSTYSALESAPKEVDGKEEEEYSALQHNNGKGSGMITRLVDYGKLLVRLYTLCSHSVNCKIHVYKRATVLAIIIGIHSTYGRS